MNAVTDITIQINPAGRNIRDLADHPREIKMGHRYHYAVVAPAYYRIPATRHTSGAAALRRLLQLINYEGVRVIDRAGRQGKLQSSAGEHWIEWEEELDPCITALDNGE